MVKYVGWSRNKKPFSQAEFKNSELGSWMSYSGYLNSYARLSKSKSKKIIL